MKKIEKNPGELTFFCGKMGAGKSTASEKLANEKNAVLLSEDEWLASLFPKQIQSLEDYVTYSNRLKLRIKSLVQSILLTGTDVVMDFPANTVKQRQWFKQIFTEIDAPHCLVYIGLSDEDCLKQIAKRRIEQPQRQQTDTPEMFERVTEFFTAPNLDEGFIIKTQERL